MSGAIVCIVGKARETLLLSAKLKLASLGRRILGLYKRGSLVIMGARTRISRGSKGCRFRRMYIKECSRPFSRRVMSRRLERVSRLVFFRVPRGRKFSFRV